MEFNPEQLNYITQLLTTSYDFMENIFLNALLTANSKGLITAPERTQLNSTGSWVELSFKEWSHRVGRCDHSGRTADAQNRRTCDNWIKWVEMSRGLWSQRPIQLNSTSWVELSWVRSGAVSRVWQPSLTPVVTLWMSSTENRRSPDFYPFKFDEVFSLEP